MNFKEYGERLLTNTEFRLTVERLNLILYVVQDPN